MVGSTHPSNSGRTFTIAILRSVPMHLHGCKVEWKRRLVAHGDARQEKWRGKRRMEWVASSLALYRNTVYPALLPLMHTPRLPAADWTDTPAYINGLVRFAERPNLVSARVPSHSIFTLQWSHRLWCRLHTMFTARVQAREIAIRRDLTLCSDATRVSTPHDNGHPSKLRSLPMLLNLPISKWRFYEHGYGGGAIGGGGLSFSGYLCSRFKFFFLINAVFIFVNKQNLPRNYLFYMFLLF